MQESHKKTEKRRRDKMNSLLADLSRLLPSCHEREGQGRTEKNEIIRRAIRHIKHLQHHTCTKQEECEMVTEKAGSMELFSVGYHECQVVSGSVR